MVVVAAGWSRALALFASKRKKENEKLAQLAASALRDEHAAARQPRAADAIVADAAADGDIDGARASSRFCAVDGITT